MKKIQLDLDALTVETFATTKDGGPEWGTVRGHESGIGCESINCTGLACELTIGSGNDPSISADGMCVCPNRKATTGAGECY